MRQRDHCKKLGIDRRCALTWWAGSGCRKRRQWSREFEESRPREQEDERKEGEGRRRRKEEEEEEGEEEGEEGREERRRRRATARRPTVADRRPAATRGYTAGGAASPVSTADHAVPAPPAVAAPSLSSSVTAHALPVTPAANLSPPVLFPLCRCTFSAPPFHLPPPSAPSSPPGRRPHHLPNPLVAAHTPPARPASARAISLPLFLIAPSLTPPPLTSRSRFLFRSRVALYRRATCAHALFLRACCPITSTFHPSHLAIRPNLPARDTLPHYHSLTTRGRFYPAGSRPARTAPGNKSLAPAVRTASTSRPLSTTDLPPSTSTPAPTFLPASSRHSGLPRLYGSPVTHICRQSDNVLVDHLVATMSTHQPRACRQRHLTRLASRLVININ
ncbi:uncharacterized protein LOC144712085 [Wolffia australiana]